MRRLVSRLLAAVPFDPMGRRILDEALDDWRHEATSVSGLWAQTRVTALGLLSIVRATAGAVTSEIVRVPVGWVLGRVLLLLSGPSLIFAMFVWTSLGTVPDLTARAELVALLLPQAILALVPLTFFFAMAYPPRTRPFPPVGLAAMAVSTVVLLAAWGAPEANQRFRLIAYAQVSGAPMDTSAVLRRGPNELLAPDLLLRAFERASGPEMGVLLFKSGLGVLTVGLVWLGWLVGTFTTRRRRAWVWAVPLTCILVVGPLAGFSPLRWGAHAHAVVGLTTWVLAFAAFGSVFFIGTRRPTGEVQFSA
jgi:hypothetical protein